MAGHMIEQIQQAVENMENLNKEDQQKFRAILKQYLSGEMNIDEAYYSLLDSDLVSMPQRCSLYVKPEKNAQDEDILKKIINTNCLNK
jgi:hypothetical protein